MRYKKSLDLIRGFQVNSLPSSKNQVVIGCLTLNLRREGTYLPIENPTSGMCGKNHYDDCLKWTNNCFGFCYSGHKVRDFPNGSSQDKGSCKAHASVSSDSPKKTSFMLSAIGIRK